VQEEVLAVGQPRRSVEAVAILTILVNPTLSRTQLCSCFCARIPLAVLHPIADLPARTGLDRRSRVESRALFRGDTAFEGSVLSFAAPSAPTAISERKGLLGADSLAGYCVVLPALGAGSGVRTI
jgi:hypothetical protein